MKLIRAFANLYSRSRRFDVDLIFKDNSYAVNWLFEILMKNNLKAHNFSSLGRLILNAFSSCQCRFQFLCFCNFWEEKRWKIIFKSSCHSEAKTIKKIALTERRLHVIDCLLMNVDCCSFNFWRAFRSLRMKAVLSQRL